MTKIHDTYSLMWGIERYVLSGAVAGLTAVQWHDTPDAYTDGSTIYLPRPDACMTDEQLLLWRYKAEHELGHEDAINSNPHWNSVMTEMKKKREYKYDDFLWIIDNLISDHVQEHNRVGQGFIGRDEVLLKGRNTFLHMSVWPSINDPDADTRLVAMFFWDTLHRQKWNPYITDVPSMAKGVEEEYNRILTAGVDPTTLKNEQEVFEAALKIRKLWPAMTEEEIRAAEQAEAEGKDGEGKGKGKKDEGRTVGGVKTAKVEKMIPGAHKEHPGDYTYGYSPERGHYKPRIPVPLEKSRVVVRSGDKRFKAAVESSLNGTNLPAKVRAYLMGMKRAKWTTGHKKGRLDTARLSDVLRNRVDVFKQKEDVRITDSAVYLLVDSSGSMSGEWYVNACAAALMLAEALQGIGVNLEIAGFTEFSGRPDGLVHDIWTPFGSRFSKPRVLDRMARMNEHLHNNADGENILYAYSRLKRQPESRKILIVLSDGEPAGYGPDGATMDIGCFTKDVVEKIEKDKSVDIVGLGMAGYSPDAFYKNSHAVQRGDRLESVLLDIVKKAIVK